MEDSQKQIDQNQEVLIAEMLRSTPKIELPSELTTNPVIHKGDETLAAPMVVKEISSAGYVFIYDTRTHEKIPCLYYMLPSKLRQRRPDGSFRFTTIDPKQLPARGTIKCLLHKDGENRGHYDELGFRVCNKENITNKYQLKQHMVKKHPQEWKAIEEERTDKEKAEDRALQRLLLASQLPKEEPRIEEPKEEPKEAKVAGVPMGDNEYYCPKCKSVHRVTSRLGKRHLKYK